MKRIVRQQNHAEQPAPRRGAGEPPRPPWSTRRLNQPPGAPVGNPGQPRRTFPLPCNRRPACALFRPVRPKLTLLTRFNTFNRNLTTFLHARPSSRSNSGQWPRSWPPNPFRCPRARLEFPNHFRGSRPLLFALCPLLFAPFAVPSKLSEPGTAQES
jgi:hypothetical protein